MIILNTRSLISTIDAFIEAAFRRLQVINRLSFNPDPAPETRTSLEVVLDDPEKRLRSRTSRALPSAARLKQ